MRLATAAGNSAADSSPTPSFPLPPNTAKPNPFYDIPAHDGEFDSTGLCRLTFDIHQNAFTVHTCNRNIFGEHMSQDTRISYRAEPSPSQPDTPNDDDRRFMLTYNAFLTDGTTRMVQRQMDVLVSSDDNVGDDCLLYCSPETDLVLPQHRQPVEKNCVPLIEGDMLLYGFHYGSLVAHNQQTGEVRTVPCPILEKTIHVLGASNVFFSLGTQALPYREGYRLSCGHVKLKCLKSAGAVTSSHAGISRLFQQIDWSTIYRHGKYLYFMFFFEFDERTLEISRVSPAFFPTTDEHSHLPYLLTFPTGLTFGRNHDEIFVSYGEGDVRCKVLGMNRDEMENVLSEHTDTDVVHPLPFRFLNVDEWNRKPRWFHYGYFYEWNCGDDMFMRVWRYLHALAAPENDWTRYVVKFRNEYHPTEIQHSS